MIEPVVAVLLASVSFASEPTASIDELLQQAESAVERVAKPEQRIIFCRLKLVQTFARAGKEKVAANALQKCFAEVETLIDGPMKQACIGEIAMTQARMGDWDGAFRTMGMFKSIKNSGAHSFWKLLFDLALENDEIPRGFEIVARIKVEWREQWKQQIAVGLAEQGKLDEALQLLDTFKSRELKDQGLLLICNWFWDSRQFDDVDRVEKLIEKRQLKALVLYRTSLEEASASDPVRADRTFERYTELAKQLGQEPSKSQLASFYAHRGDSEKAVATAMTDEDEKSRQSSLADIARILAKDGHCREAIALVRSIEKQPLLENIFELDEVRREASVGLMQAGNAADAIRTAETIVTSFIRSKAWRQIGAIQSKTDPAGASSSLTKALASAQRLPKKGGTDLIALNEVAQTQVEIGDLDGARKTFQLALEATLQYEDPDYQSSFAFDISRNFAKSLGATEVCEWALMQSTPLVTACVLIGAADGRLDSK